MCFQLLHPRTCQRFRRPDAKLFSGLVNSGSEQASLLASEAPQMLAMRFQLLRQQLHLAEQIAEFVVIIAEQILAYIAEKVQVAGQYWNRKVKVVCQTAGRFGYRPANVLSTLAPEVAHDGAGWAELRRGFFQLWQYGVAPFGGNLPCAQNPTAPASEGYQQCAFNSCAKCSAAVLAECAFNSCTSSVDVQRPASVGGQRGAQGWGRIAMKRFQVHDKTLAEFADFATGKMDAVVLF